MDNTKKPDACKVAIAGRRSYKDGESEPKYIAFAANIPSDEVMAYLQTIPGYAVNDRMRPGTVGKNAPLLISVQDDNMAASMRQGGRYEPDDVQRMHQEAQASTVQAGALERISKYCTQCEDNKRARAGLPV